MPLHLTVNDLPTIPNFANTDLTLDANRTHNADGHNINFTDTGHYKISGVAGNPIRLIIDNATATDPKILSFRTGDSQRWAFRVDGAGDDFALRRYDNSGTFVDAPIAIDRTTALITLQNTVNLADYAASSVITTDSSSNLVANTTLPVNNAPLGTQLMFYSNGSQALTSSTTLEELLVSAQLTAGLTAGDYFEWSAFIRATSNANAKTFRVYLNTSNTLVGATLIATATTTTNAQTQRFSRENWVMSSTTLRNGAPAATSSLTGTTTAFTDTKTVPTMAAGFWLLFTCQKAVASDSAGYEMVQCARSKNS